MLIAVVGVAVGLVSGEGSSWVGMAVVSKTGVLWLTPGLWVGAYVGAALSFAMTVGPSSPSRATVGSVVVALGLILGVAWKSFDGLLEAIVGATEGEGVGGAVVLLLLLLLIVDSGFVPADDPIGEG